MSFLNLLFSVHKFGGHHIFRVAQQCHTKDVNPCIGNNVYFCRIQHDYILYNMTTYLQNADNLWMLLKIWNLFIKGQFSQYLIRFHKPDICCYSSWTVPAGCAVSFSSNAFFLLGEEWPTVANKRR